MKTVLRSFFFALLLIGVFASVSHAEAVTFTRDLRLGSRGSDVVALQNFLIQNNLLQIPNGVALGRFGALTKAAVKEYQKKLGISPIGVFGSVTRQSVVTIIVSKTTVAQVVESSTAQTPLQTLLSLNPIVISQTTLTSPTTPVITHAISGLSAS